MVALVHVDHELLHLLLIAIKWSKQMLCCSGSAAALFCLIHFLVYYVLMAFFCINYGIDIFLSERCSKNYKQNNHAHVMRLESS